MKTRFLTMLLICLPSVLLDQISKAFATSQLLNKPGLSYFGGILRMQYARNLGAWGGLGDQLPLAMRKLVFTLGVGVFLAVLVWYILRHAHPTLVTVGLSLILSGGIGNLIDRALYGYVVDFLYLGYDPVSWLHTNIFNVADMAIMAGAAVLLVHAFTHREPAANAAAPEEPAAQDGPAPGQAPMV